MSPDNETRLSESEEKAPDPYLGRTFDGFRIEELIGRGGMGAVYRATQLSLGRSVAIKVLPTEFAEHPQFLQRFHREVDVLARLSHPNIVTVIDRGELDGHPYLVMEYVEGTSLRDVIKAGALPPAEALATVRAVLSALEHAHDKGIIHRDIKPENVLVAKGGIVKVADFGLGRLLDPVDTTRLTHTHLMLGTFEYMSPEQREKAKEADERSDLYATGVVLYEMIAGELPIGVFEPLSEKRPGECDSRIDDVVKRSLEKAPERRYQRASEMGDDVSRLLTAAPIPDAGPAAPKPPRGEAGTAMSPAPEAGAAATPLDSEPDEDAAEPSKGRLLAAALVAVAGVFLLIEEGLLPGALTLVVAIYLAVPWLRQYAFNEYAVGRIEGPLPDKFAKRIVEDPEVQIWLRRQVPGLWHDFPSGLDFGTDDGRLMVEIERCVSPHVRTRFCAALGRVLEANANGSLRRIATADEGWERKTSADGIPLVAGFGRSGDPEPEPKPASKSVHIGATIEPPNWVVLVALVMLGLYLASANEWRDEGWAWLGACVVAGVALFRRGQTVFKFLFWIAIALAVPALIWFSLAGTDGRDSSSPDFAESETVVRVRLPRSVSASGKEWLSRQTREWLEAVTPLQEGVVHDARDVAVQAKRDKGRATWPPRPPELLTELTFSFSGHSPADTVLIRRAVELAVHQWFFHDVDAEHWGHPIPPPQLADKVVSWPPPSRGDGPRVFIARAGKGIRASRARRAIELASDWLRVLDADGIGFGIHDGRCYVWAESTLESRRRFFMAGRQAHRKKLIAAEARASRAGALTALLLERTFPGAFYRSAELWQRFGPALTPVLDKHPVPVLTPKARVELAVVSASEIDLRDLEPWVGEAARHWKARVLTSSLVLPETVVPTTGELEVVKEEGQSTVFLVVQSGVLLEREMLGVAVAWGAAIRCLYPGRTVVRVPEPDRGMAVFIDANPPARNPGAARTKDDDGG